MFEVPSISGESPSPFFTYFPDHLTSTFKGVTRLEAPTLLSGSIRDLQTGHPLKVQVDVVPFDLLSLSICF